MVKALNLYRSPAEWTESNPILGAGQVGKEKYTHYIKVGDGRTHWNDLTYAGKDSGESSAPSAPALSFGTSYSDTREFDFLSDDTRNSNGEIWGAANPINNPYYDDLVADMSGVGGPASLKVVTIKKSGLYEVSVNPRLVTENPWTNEATGASVQVYYIRDNGNDSDVITQITDWAMESDTNTSQYDNNFSTPKMIAFDAGALIITRITPFFVMPTELGEVEWRARVRIKRYLSEA